MKTILRMPQLVEKLNLVPSTIYKLIREEGFPPPIKLTKRSSGWHESEVENWLDVRTVLTREVES